MQPIGTLTPTQPYDFTLTLSVLARFPHPTVDITHDGAYWRALRIGDALALFRVKAGDDGTCVLRLNDEFTRPRAFAK